MLKPILGPFRRFWESDRGLTTFLAILIVNVFVLPPLFTPGLFARLTFEVIFALLLVAGIASVSVSRATRSILTTVAIVAVIVRWLAQLAPSLGLDVAGAASGIASTGLLAVVVLGQVLRAGPVTAHRVLGAVAAYLLFGLTFAGVYHLVSLVEPGAIAGPGIEPGAGIMSFVYFSFITLTTVGYGDVTPVHVVARSLAILEALTGQLYPAILIARLVSLEIRDRGD